MTLEMTLAATDDVVRLRGRLGGGSTLAGYTGPNGTVGMLINGQINKVLVSVGSHQTPYAGPILLVISQPGPTQMGG